MAVKILSVDDELDLEVLLTQYFRRQIRKGEYEFAFAHNGLEALQKLLETPDFDIILSDINMPEMDGLTLLAKVNELKNPAMKCIMVSAYGDMDNIRSAMNKGAFDFATKPIDLDDLSRTIEKAIEQVRYIRESQQEHNQLESIKNDLAIAGEIQQTILPRSFPPFPELTEVVDIYASMTPAKDVGGDFYDFFQIDDERIGLVIADVSGKGVPASLFMAVSRTLFRATALRGVSSAECLTYANKLLCKESLDSMFVTVFYGIYHYKTGMMDYTNAGHNPPYLLRGGRTVECLPVASNFVVGVFDDIEFESNTLTFGIGDTLLLYTDGVTEAFNDKREQFSESNLQDILASMHESSSAKEVVTSVLQSVKTFSGDYPQSDDITLLSLQRIK
ncbi:PP2C family protein-serine/threonine phosphatase [Bacteroides fragilis]|uniref:PP2C family protein-serine/threonine phosphatase n=1 Tax=Bacteroides fragilis TaxID=817 RepID=UPI000F00F219|nr:SpoIIE family protein phosphatase [Bacteroides fragilis]MCB5656874.1 SpoIIE family protein phosphatase [Bacteroides fragilis]MCB5699527.1 SpoIIE family protein phosphatase [Bacteroides fragilis]RHI15144.1 response regulator [Bacteroides fragilis]RHI27741.1 response regulator [Bacteroides fragilis]